MTFFSDINAKRSTVAGEKLVRMKRRESHEKQIGSLTSRSINNTEELGNGT